MENDLGAIVLRLGRGWDAESLKEFAEMLADIVKSFNDAGMCVTSQLLKAPPIIQMPTANSGIVLADARGRLRLAPSIPTAKTVVEEDDDLKEIL